MKLLLILKLDVVVWCMCMSGIDSSWLCGLLCVISLICVFRNVMLVLVVLVKLLVMFVCLLMNCVMKLVVGLLLQLVLFLCSGCSVRQNMNLLMLLGNVFSVIGGGRLLVCGVVYSVLFGNMSVSLVICSILLLSVLWLMCIECMFQLYGWIVWMDLNRCVLWYVFCC